jgi:AbrB family looped-hinge helix DNA binding protein
MKSSTGKEQTRVQPARGAWNRQSRTDAVANPLHSMIFGFHAGGKETCGKVRNMGKAARGKVRTAEPAMQKLARITSKGQITVPLEIRRFLGVRPGDKLLFKQDETGVRVLPLRAESPFEKYRGIGNPGIGSGRKAVMRWYHELRGHDDSD